MNHCVTFFLVTVWLDDAVGIMRKVSRLGAQMVTCSSLGCALEVEEGSGCAFAVGRRDTERERERGSFASFFGAFLSSVSFLLRTYPRAYVEYNRSTNVVSM